VIANAKLKPAVVARPTNGGAGFPARTPERLIAAGDGRPEDGDQQH
jgi:hypothetical protein